MFTPLAPHSQMEVMEVTTSSRANSSPNPSLTVSVTSSSPADNRSPLLAVCMDAPLQPGAALPACELESRDLGSMPHTCVYRRNQSEDKNQDWTRRGEGMKDDHRAREKPFGPPCRGSLSVRMAICLQTHPGRAVCSLQATSS